MRRKLEKYKLFHKELDINDFSIPEFVNWMNTIDLSNYITVTKKPIETDEVGYAKIVVINIDGIVVQGAIVTIDGLGWHAETDENGVCIISGFPINEQHLVNVAAEGYEIFSKYFSANEITPLTVILQPESESEEDGSYNVNISVVDENQNPIQGAMITISADNMEECNGITNEMGLCAIEIPQEEIYSITAEAEGYLVNTADYFVSELYGLMTIVLEKEGSQGEVQPIVVEEEGEP